MLTRCCTCASLRARSTSWRRRGGGEVEDGAGGGGDGDAVAASDVLVGGGWRCGRRCRPAAGLAAGDGDVDRTSSAGAGPRARRRGSGRSVRPGRRRAPRPSAASAGSRAARRGRRRDAAAGATRYVTRRSTHCAPKPAGASCVDADDAVLAVRRARRPPTRRPRARTTFRSTRNRDPQGNETCRRRRPTFPTPPRAPERNEIAPPSGHPPHPAAVRRLPQQTRHRNVTKFSAARRAP